MTIAILIPARLQAARLPHKPLADIHGEPMIVHVWRRAMASQLGEVAVACAEEAIANVVRAAGGRAILTDPSLPSGSDRIFAALQHWEGKQPEIIINLQGDLPTLDPALIHAVVQPLLHRPEVDIATLAAPIGDESERTNPNVVKAVFAGDASPGGRALYFSRATIPANQGSCWHHIGIYAYRRSALARFVALPPSALEKREKLEQLRALEAGMHIEVVTVNTVPLGVDTPEDLERARFLFDRTVRFE
jgi:3-deoxy-manno-octulosonate cytidylyltransferase (CMP-KDO synthetase)